ncbi:MAG: hypothetical protein KGK07_05575 [Chloroflexota bacterium]|nr:hypothetical protein [Chloroflexota bacterium]
MPVEGDGRSLKVIDCNGNADGSGDQTPYNGGPAPCSASCVGLKRLAALDIHSLADLAAFQSRQQLEYLASFGLTSPEKVQAARRARDLQACTADPQACAALGNSRSRPMPTSLPAFPGESPVGCDSWCRIHNVGDAAANGINKALSPLGLHFSTHVEQNWQANAAHAQGALGRGTSNCALAQFTFAWGLTNFWASYSIDNDFVRYVARVSAAADTTTGAVGATRQC